MAGCCGSNPKNVIDFVGMHFVLVEPFRAAMTTIMTSRKT